MAHGQEADLFVLMTAKEELTTRDGKPYFKVGFRDHAREVTLSDLGRFALGRRLPRGLDSPARFTSCGPSIARPTTARSSRCARFARVCDGRRGRRLRSPAMCLPQSRFDAQAMFDELLAIARERIDDAPLRDLVVSLLERTSRAAADAARRHAQSPCLRRRLAGARAERDADLRLPGRQVRRVLSRHAAAAEQGPGRGRRDPARHRQAARDRRAARRAPSTRPRAT